MFESITSPKQQPAPQPAPTPPTTPLEIHAMPERFLGSKSVVGKPPAPSGKPGSKKLIIAVAIIVIVAIGVAAALLFTGVLNRNAANTSNVNLVTNTPVNANANANRNVNLNANANANANGNANSNANANANGNENLNSNVNANANANANVSSNPQAKSSADADKDGLTDAEEVIFSTNPSSGDSDGDSFLDGSEVKLGYSPKGAGKLATSSLVVTYTNTLYGASVIYPNGWSSMARTSTEQLFTNPTGDETITLSVEDNAARLTAKQWYLTKAPTVDATTLVDAAAWDGKSSGIISPDGLAYYFANGSQVYVVSLSFGLKPTVDSRATFEMVARSLVVDPTKVNLNTNAAANQNGNANANVNANANSNTNANMNT